MGNADTYFRTAVEARNHAALLCERHGWHDPRHLDTRKAMMGAVRLYADAAGVTDAEALRLVQEASEGQLIAMGY